MDETPLLLTPGPLTTAAATRAAMTRDYGSRDPGFVEMNSEVRRRLEALAPAPGAYAAVMLQGSGTFAVEAALGTLVPPGGQALVLVNGAYGERMAEILRRLGRRAIALELGEGVPLDPAAVGRFLADNHGITHVAAVYCETTTGLLNPAAALADVVAKAGRRLILDAMSALGALPIAGLACSAVVASSNKCLEGAPGVGFVLARREDLAECAGNAPSLSLDLHDQWRRFEQDGQWRFTPPTHVLAALHQALLLHEAEGGVAGRGARYAENCRTLVRGMRSRGYETLLTDEQQAPIIVTFRQPARFDFGRFYDGLLRRGFAIYPGKLTAAPTFRVGCIGQVYPADIERFLAAADEVQAELGFSLGG